MNYLKTTGDKFDMLANRVDVLGTLRALAGLDGMGGQSVDTGPALEMSDELARQSGRKPHGIFLSHASLQTRDLQVGTATAGGHTVATELRGFVDLLRPRSKVIQAGARVMPGLVGKVAIPRQTGASTAYWIAESANITAASQPAFDQVLMEPRTVGAFTDISRRMLLQSSIGIQEFVIRDLITVIGLAVDAAAINGAGGNQPTGLLSQSGVQTQTIAGAKPTWAEIVEMETKVGVENADAPSCAYMTTAEVRADLRQIKMNPLADGSDYIWQPRGVADADGMVNGYRGMVSQNLPRTLGAGTDEHALIFGNWFELMIGMWSAVDVLADPFTGATSGTLRINVFQDVDAAVRHPKAFVKAQYAV